MASRRRARGVSGAASRGMTGRGRRGRGARVPRGTHRRRGRGGSAVGTSAAASEEGVCDYDFLLRILSRVAGRVPLPYSFAPVVSELGLSGLWLRLQGCSRSPLWVELQAESSFLVFLSSGWRAFARQLNLREGDSLCCRFDGEETLTVRAFDAGGNRLEPCWESSSGDDSGGADGAFISSSAGDSPATSRTADSSTGNGATRSGDSSSGGGNNSSSFEQDADVKPPIKRVRR